MKRNLVKTAALMLLAATSLAPAQEKDTAKEKPVAPAARTADRAELEKKFEQTLKNATFEGRWCSLKDGRLGPEREDRYTILDARKLGGDVWIIRSRIQYGERDVTVPIPVNVLWAGDTAVISLTDLAIPNAGTYTARVLVHGDTYAGSWSGGSNAGLMNGIIKRSAP